MAEKTFIVKLAGDSKSYQDSMSQASKALDKYQKQNLSSDAAVKTLSSTLTKYISVAALAKGAQEALTRTIHGSQTTADAFTATISAAKTVVDSFFTALSTGDFTTFNMGLTTIVSKAKDAAAALDALGNASISWGYFQSAGMADMTEYQAIVNDPNRSLAERQAAAAGMTQIRDRLKGYAEGYKERALEAMAKELAKTTNLAWTDISIEDLEKNLALDLLPVEMSQREKTELGKRYQEYVAETEKVMQKYRGEQKMRMRGGTAAGYTLYYEQTDEQKQRQKEELAALAVQYKDVILNNQILVRGTDEWLQQLVQMVQQADAAERSLRRLNSAVQSANNSLGIKPETPAGPAKTLGALPAAAGIPLMDVTGPNLPDKLPETVENLEDTDVVLARIAENANAAADGFDRMAAASEGFNSLGRAAEYMGQALAQSDSKGWKAAGSIVASVGAAVQAYTQLSQAAAQAAAAQAMAETPTIWGKIAAVTMLVTAFANASSQLRSGIQSFAEGGIVQGNNFRDGITARVSSGEMYINEADQRRLYDTIHRGNYGGGGGPSVVTGEQIVLAVNSYGRRSNRGELVFAGKG